ncbi:hypothetical protein BTA51_28650 [Hahella sp. CCB-MM4]|uniref:hypothetical protein n=1 Tax=Hahella sp. (strain CCB-MM4) TaxID=1926491 RepID=UPI000B9BD9D4|nr:hypothetical protein [Hahella sp. CCB-MM4]OZG69924.1 hypothetical protein BTA51_28650 [Hahella sp. CCB-MM4]
MSFKLYTVCLLLLFQLSGCTVTYKSEADSGFSYGLINQEFGTEERSFILSSPSNCVVRYSIKAVGAIGSKYTNPRPKIDQYARWTEETISEYGCVAKEVGSEHEEALHIEIDYDIANREAGAEILAVFTLYLVPIDESRAHRTYRFIVGEKEKNLRVVKKTWFGWIFLPVHVFSYFDSYAGYTEGKIYRNQLLSILENQT